MPDRGRIASFVAISVTLMFAGMLLLVSLHVIPLSNKDVANIMIGALGSQFANLVSYYFGSSRTAERQQSDRQPSHMPLPLDKTLSATPAQSEEHP